jgi:uncharacterized protein (UPF0218 family)
LGLSSEVGEVEGKLKKFIRGDFELEEFKEKVKPEIGDCLWYLAEINLRYCHDDISVMRFDRFRTFGDATIGDMVSEVSELQRIRVLMFSPDRETKVESTYIETLLQQLLKVANCADLVLDDCMKAVTSKLVARKNKGTLKGDGDGVDR